MSKKTVDEHRLAERLAEIGEEAEAGEEDQISKPIPGHVKVTRGNARSKVLQVRLNPDEYAAVARIAKDRKLPPSTVARETLLKLIDNPPVQDPYIAPIGMADRLRAIAVDVFNDHPTLGRGNTETDQRPAIDELGMATSSNSPA